MEKMGPSGGMAATTQASRASQANLRLATGWLCFYRNGKLFGQGFSLGGTAQRAEQPYYGGNIAAVPGAVAQRVQGTPMSLGISSAL